MTASPPLVRALRQPFWAVARPVPKAKGKPVLALPGDLAAAPCPAVPARDLPLSSHAPKVISPAPLVLSAPTGRSSPRGAVLVSIALHLGLLGGYAVFASTARPLIVPDLNTAEVSLISEAQFLAMSAPQPVLTMATAPALATPALAAPMPEPASLASAIPTALPAAEPPSPVPEPMPEPVAQKPAAPAPKAIKPKAAAPVAEAPRQTKPETKTAKAEVPAKPVHQAAEPAAAPAPQPAAQSAAKSDPAASAGEAKALKADWGSKVRARINRKVALPADSAPGTVKVRLEIAASGALLAVGIAQSSGQAALDAAALKAVKSAAPFARAPKGLSEPSYSFSLPITFKN
ncbi:TonB Periplasmic protein TonB, links inner and outer membranes [Paracoccaceae bacterium]